MARRGGEVGESGGWRVLRSRCSAGWTFMMKFVFDPAGGLPVRAGIG